jgi:sulfite reductase (ferredoxin)
MSDDLATLGAGNGSANESIKLQSRHLRGSLAEELAADGDAFGKEAEQLLKFHGSYQQEDRDERRARKAAGLPIEHAFMVRSRIPGGVLTAKQYLIHDEIAARYGNATLRLTTRQGIQLHGVVKRDLKATIRAIDGALLTTLAACGDVNRNVMSCPAPDAAPAQAQVQRYARAIAERLTPKTRAYHEIWLDGEKLDAPEEEPIYGATYLPRKFKIAVACADDNCVDAYTQDLAFVAGLENGALAGFTVLAGGGMGSTNGKRETYPRLATPLCFARPGEVVEIAETIVTIQRDHGDRKNRKHARMKYLVEERGIDWFRGELERRLGRAVEPPRPVRFDRVDDHLGWGHQAGGGLFLGLYVENGRVADRPASLLRTALRAALLRFSPGVRITGQQNLLLTDLPASSRAELDALFAAHGVQTDPDALGLRRGAMACPALPTCGQAVAEAERVLPDLVSAIELELAGLDVADEPVEIRMTGCPNGCARPRMGDVGIVGRSLGIYDLYLGGDRTGTRLNHLFAQGVRQDAIVATLRPVFVRWRRERFFEEALGDFVARKGIESFRPALDLPVEAGV